MKVHRFVGKIEDKEITRQIRDVLKLKAEERVILSDGKGQDELLEIISLGTEIKYKIIEKLKPVGTERKVNLYLAILKKENFELAAQKAVECGVSAIIPIITERTIKTGLNIPRLEKIILEASEQCGRSIVPTLSPILDFENALKNTSGEKIIFHLNGSEYMPDKTAAKAGQDSKEINIFVGPEGGFAEKEIELAKDAGFSVVSLGALTLRGETAAIIGTYRAVNAI